MNVFHSLNELFLQLQDTNLDTVPILGHTNPDGDTVGSVMATAYYLYSNFPDRFRNIIPYIAEGLDRGPKKIH